MNNYIIRDYRKEDYPQILSLWAETGLLKPERNDTQESVEKCLAIGGKFLVMTDTSNNMLIGSSWMTFDGRRISISHFGIRQSYQRKGLGTRLAKASLAYVYSHGYQVRLEVHKKNLIAKHIYEKLGFFAYTDYDIYMIRDVQEIPPENRVIS
jgi:ribosomal protein S18 acetylase RimI-like enzyme